MAVSSTSLLAEIQADKKKQIAEREQRLKNTEEQVRNRFRTVTDYIVKEAHEENDEIDEETEAETPKETGKTPKKAAKIDMSEYSDDEIDDDEIGESDSDETGKPSTPDGFTYDYIPKFVNNLQVWGGVGYFNYRMKPREYSPRRDQLRALRKLKQATPEDLEELDTLNELLERMEDAKQEIIKAGKLTKMEEKQLSKALEKYLEVKNFKISPETTLAMGFAAPMLRMGVAVERVKSELGI